MARPPRREPRCAAPRSAATPTPTTSCATGRAYQPDLPPFLPMAMAGLERFRPYEGSVKFREPADVERPVFQTLPIDLFADPASAAMLADRVARAARADRRRLARPGSLRSPGGAGPWQGCVGTVEQCHDARPIARPAPSRAAWRRAVVGARHPRRRVGRVHGHARRPAVGRRRSPFSAQIAFYALTPFLFEALGMDTYGLPAFGWIAGWLLAFAATGMTVREMGSEHRRFAEGALGKYLPPDIAAQIIRDPKKLSLTGEKRADLHLVHRHRGLHQPQPRPPAGTRRDPAQRLSRRDERDRAAPRRDDRQVRRRRRGRLLGRADRARRRRRPRARRGDRRWSPSPALSRSRAATTP